MIQRKNRTVYITEDCVEHNSYSEAVTHQTALARNAVAELLIKANVPPTTAYTISVKIIESQSLREEFLASARKAELFIQDE